MIGLSNYWAGVIGARLGMPLDDLYALPTLLPSPSSLALIAPTLQITLNLTTFADYCCQNSTTET